MFEFSEFLVKVAKVTDVGAAFPQSVTYHDACHALRELHLKQEPRELLRHVRGLELVEMPYSEECCGFGGTFSTKFSMISVRDGRNQSGNAASIRRRVCHLERSELPDAHRRHSAARKSRRSAPFTSRAFWRRRGVPARRTEATAQEFLQQSAAAKSADAERTARPSARISTHYDVAVARRPATIPELASRARACQAIKWEAIEHLDQYL